MSASVTPELARLRMLVLRRALDEYVPPEEMVEAALQALLAGVESSWLPVLAGLGRNELDEASSTLRRLAEELGWEPTLSNDPVATRWELVRHWCTEVAAGRLDPEEGARRLWWDGYGRLESPSALAPFVSACDDLDEWSPRSSAPRESILAGIVDDARTLLSGPWPPR